MDAAVSGPTSLYSSTQDAASGFTATAANVDLSLLGLRTLPFLCIRVISPPDHISGSVRRTRINIFSQAF